MKYLNALLAVLFILFAYFQINDPDSWIWISIYGWIALIAGLAAKGKYSTAIFSVGLAACLFEGAFLFPKFISWLRAGMPSITGTMRAESPHIEVAREFFGLFIALLTMLFIFIQWKRFPVR